MNLIVVALSALMLWQTIDESSGRRYSPGDVINATKETSQVIRLYSSGTADAPITVNFNGVSLDGARIEFMSGANHWTINGLKMRGGQRLIDAYNSEGITLANCELGPIANDGSYCVRLVKCDKFRVTNCTIKTFDSFWSSPVGVRGDGIVTDNCNDGSILGNFFNDAGHVAVNIRNSARNRIVGNRIDNDLHTGVSLLNIPGNPGNSTQNIVEYNRIRYFNKRPSEPELPGVGIELLYCSGNIVRNNELSDGRSTAITIAADASKGETTDNQILNNTIYKPGGRGIEIGMFGVITSDTVRGNIVRKNIIYGSAWPDEVRGAAIALTLKNYYTAGNDISDNFLTNNTIKWRHDAGYTILDPVKLGIKTGNPMFVFAGFDFRLRSGSLAAGYGAYP